MENASMNQISPLQNARAAYKPKLPSVLNRDPNHIALIHGGPTKSVADQEAIKSLFPRTYPTPEVRFEDAKKGSIRAPTQPKTVWSVLSRGQAHGGQTLGQA